MDLGNMNDFDPDKAWAAGVRVVIAKAGQWTPGHFPANRQQYLMRRSAWERLGGIWMSYFLPFANSTPQEMFDAWMACESDPMHGFAIDWESDRGDIDETATQDQIKELARLFEDRFKCLPILYGSNTLREMTPDNVLLACPMWLAAPTGKTQPTVFAPKNPVEGARTIFWQWTQDSTAISKQFDGADFNVFDGSYNDLLMSYPKFQQTTSATTILADQRRTGSEEKTRV